MERVLPSQAELILPRGPSRPAMRGPSTLFRPCRLSQSLPPQSRSRHTRKADVPPADWATLECIYGNPNTSERGRELRTGAAVRAPVAGVPASGTSRRAKGASDRDDLTLIQERLARLPEETGVLQIWPADLEVATSPRTERSAATGSITNPAGC